MSEKTKKQPDIFLIAVIYYIALWVVWAGKVLVLEPALEKMFSMNVVALITGVIKLVIWVVPAGLLIRKYESELEVKPEEMFRMKKSDWKTLLIVALIMTAYVLFGAYSNFKRIAINPDFKSYSLINKFLIVGITEEIVFRGFLFNATLKKFKNRDIAIAVNALMFLVIHFPIWLKDGAFISNFTNLGFLTIIFLSVLFSYYFAEKRTLVIPVALHMLWDLLVTVFYG